jgi:hypothetical protein
MPVSRKKPEQGKERTLATRGNGSATPTIDPEMVARLAHSYWEARGCVGGSPEEDWLRAEQELSGKIARAASN